MAVGHPAPGGPFGWPAGQLALPGLHTQETLVPGLPLAGICAPPACV